MHVVVWPPIQIVPSGSWLTCTRPSRPSTVPWLATYGASSRFVSNVDAHVGLVGLHPGGSPEVRALFPKDGAMVEDPVTFQR